MSNTVIKIENLSKEYYLGEVGTGTLSHDLHRWWARFRGKEDPYSKVGRVNDLSGSNKPDYIWALRDINLEIGKGEVFGIIGKNGAGKSTLLKIISRITAPSKGSIKAKGRIASLLEVGTGMHPELTGRENIYLNGAILGMKHHEITARFDGIVEFSGCELFVDTPIKRYSTGMRVRLGFSVAAFLDAEILIVDEVLAVGDLQFQKKCVGKMEEMGSEGRTILFVSHNMAAVASLTTHSVLLENGGLIANDSTPEVIKIYLEGMRDKSPETPIKERVDREGDGRARVIGLSITDESSNIDVLPLSPERKQIVIDINCKQEVFVSMLALAILSAERQRIFWIDSSDQIEPFKLFKGCHKVTLTLRDGVCPSPGDYYINVALNGDEGMIDYIADAHKFTIADGDFFGSGKFPDKRPAVFVEHDWRIEQVSHT